MKDQTVGQLSPDLHTSNGDVNDQGEANNFKAVGDMASHSTADPTPSNPSMNNEAIEDVSPQIEPSQNREPSNAMHRFMWFPAEIRIMIWGMAMAEAQSLNGSVQRFRFDLIYDPSRVKPNKDKSRGWVACFTPLKISTRRKSVFLWVCFESREIMFRTMTMLTVHEVPVDQNGQRMAPRKCHMPFNLTKDDFCVEGITHALDDAKKDKDNKDAVWDPDTLPLADLLDNALGLRFARRIKRLAIIPHRVDVAVRPFFMETTNGRNMATLAKRFPALVSVKSAIPVTLSELRPYPHLMWRSASLRGKRQGGPSGMSKEAQDALYHAAWFRIFWARFLIYRLVITEDLFDGCLCVL